MQYQPTSTEPASTKPAEPRFNIETTQRSSAILRTLEWAPPQLCQSPEQLHRPGEALQWDKSEIP
ncbi:hypothetical protein VCV18_005390 [Metarhizium anisopliae]